MLHIFKLYLAQEVDFSYLRIRSIANVHAENIFGMFFFLNEFVDCSLRTVPELVVS